MKAKLCYLTCLLFITGGCATQNKSIATGALVGATGGAVLGHQPKERMET